MAIRFRSTDSSRGGTGSPLSRSQRSKALLRRAGILTAIILACLLVALAVTKIFIDRQAPSEFVVYQGVVEEEQTRDAPKVQEISGGKPPAAPPITPVIVSTATVEQSSFPFEADVPDAPSESGGLGGDGIGEDLGDGMGEGTNRGGMGGKKVPSSFAGYFWDLKRRPDGKPSLFAQDSGNVQVLEFESNFYNKGWQINMLSPSYMRADMQLFSTCFFLPNCRDEEAVHAYDPKGKQKLQKSRWVALYRAKVKAPETGTFRFVGAADTVMAVRFDGKNVLACGLHNLRNATWNEWIDKPNIKSQRTLIRYDGTEAWNTTMGGFEAGDEFSVKKDEWYEMQVMISEIGGGEFGFCLLVEEISPLKTPIKDGKPLFQLFRTAFSAPTVKEAYEAIKPENKQSDVDGDVMLLKDIPYDPDSRVWEAKPVNLNEPMK